MKKMMLLFLLSAGLLMTAASPNEAEVVTVTGMVHEYESDDEGNILSVYLETEEEYLTVVARGKGLALNQMVGMRVQVTGVITEVDEEFRQIEVHRYEQMAGVEIDE